MIGTGEIRPVGEYVLLSEIRKPLGLLVPDTAPESGVVVGVGEGRVADGGAVIPLPVNPGDTVYYDKKDSSPFKIGGIDYVLVKWDGVLMTKSGSLSSLRRQSEIMTTRIVLTRKDIIADGSTVESVVYEKSSQFSAYSLYVAD